MDFTSFHPVDWQKSGVESQPQPQSKPGKGDHESHPPVLDGRFLEASGGGSNGDRDVSGACHRSGVPPQSVCHTENLVLACVCMCTQTLPDRHRKCQGFYSEPLSEGGSTNPWPSPGYTRQPNRGERQDPFGGGGGGSVTTPTLAQGGQA